MRKRFEGQLLILEFEAEKPLFERLLALGLGLERNRNRIFFQPQNSPSCR
jgi:hypothetical protein